MNQSDGISATARLCPACGLCCNGVLFGDVELQRGDDPVRLAELGLIVRRRKGKLRLLQPCSCFDGRHCRIYADRPVRCRTFECRLLQEVEAKQSTVETALDTIASARRQVQVIRKLLRRLGQREENLPLIRRYARVMSEPLDLAEPKACELRGQLMRAVDRLMALLHGRFLD